MKAAPPGAAFCIAQCVKVISRKEKDIADKMKKYDVICIGTAIVDSIIRGFDPEPVSAAGFRAESGSLSAGGEAVNEAAAFSKLGMKTAVLCALGNDPAGNIISEELERNNVDTGLIARSDDHPTPVTTMFVDEKGNRKSITNRAHDHNFHPERYTDVFRDTRAVIMGSLFRAPFNDPDVILAVAREARKNGVMTIADTKLPNFRKLSLDDISESLPYIDCITPNEDEGRYYTGKDDPEEMADAFLERGAGSVIVKLGGKGCFYKDNETSIRVPAFDVDAVDATGAGDNFIAGFVSEILRGSDVKDALVFANAAGAICSSAVGAGTALRDRDQVLEFMRASVLTH